MPPESNMPPVINSQSPTPNKNHTRLLFISLALIVVIAGVVGGGYFYTTLKKGSTVAEAPEAQGSVTLKTYKDIENGFEVSYPSDYVVYDEIVDGKKSPGLNIKKEIEGGKWVLWASFFASKEAFMMTDLSLGIGIPNTTFNGYQAVNLGLTDGSNADENCQAEFFENTTDDSYSPSCGAVIQVMSGPARPISTIESYDGPQILGSPGGVIAYGMYIKVGEEEAKGVEIKDPTYASLRKEQRYATYGDPAKIYNSNRPALMQIVSSFKFI